MTTDGGGGSISSRGEESSVSAGGDVSDYP